ncbi:chlorophyll a/b binding light-harvesting protein [Prochlorococcus sp. MIT 1300]|uniref:chlorophyll a/b binding light-harvesting protein n=1 Tax=Prochlorococcus sp. MIT 1300 TaxID=3096218 RepID=UPI002A74B667|nr:chlorophyll a/b binding light-harvesting protein [Prochlorococcus sp. MIT 1300]
MQTYGNPNPTYGWWVGNSVVTNRSSRFIGSHVAHTGLICFTAGASTLWDLARYDPSVPMGHQGLVSIPHLASIGIGFDESGVWTGAGVFFIAAFHLICSMVYGGAGLLHSAVFSEDTQNSSGLFAPDRPEHRQAKRFKLEWDNPDNQTFILGHHLIFLGVANIWFVEWARVHGIYDPAIDAIRQVEYNLNLAHIWNHQFDFLTINNLEDVMGGHAFLAFAQILGGAHHIATKMGSGLLGPYTKFKGAGLLSAEAILSWSLAGIGWMAIIAAFWCATNTTVYPEAWYGEPLAIKFGISPYWVDTVGPIDGAPLGHTTRAWLTNVHYYLGFFFIQGHLWHALRAMGFDFKRIRDAVVNLDNTRLTLN